MNLRPIPSVPAMEGDDADAAAMAPLCSVFRRFLKAKGLKYTHERADVLDAIIQRDDIFEAEELLADMRERGLHASKATIYRTLKLLQEAGIITQTLFDAERAHYRLIYGRAPRDYMVCIRTGEIVEFSNEELTRIRDRICEEKGWDPVGHRFQIYAISPETSKRQNAKTSK